MRVLLATTSYQDTPGGHHDMLSVGTVGGYATDVLNEEPPPADHPLLKHPKALITPHIGSRTYESVPRQAMRRR